MWTGGTLTQLINRLTSPCSNLLYPINKLHLMAEAVSKQHVYCQNTANIFSKIALCLLSYWSMRSSHSSHLLADKVNTNNNDKYHQRVVTTWITSLQHLLHGNLWPVNEGTVILGDCGWRWLLRVIMLALVRICCAPLRLIGLIPHQGMHLEPVYSHKNPACCFGIFNLMTREIWEK